MKICSRCGKKFPDGMLLCPADRLPLETFSESAPAPTPAKPPVGENTGESPAPSGRPNSRVNSSQKEPGVPGVRPSPQIRRGGPPEADQHNPSSARDIDFGELNSLGWERDDDSRFLIPAPGVIKRILSGIIFIGGFTMIIGIKTMFDRDAESMTTESSLKLIALGFVFLVVGFLLRSLFEKFWVVDPAFQACRIRRSLPFFKFETNGFVFSEVMEIGVNSRPQDADVENFNKGLGKAALSGRRNDAQLDPYDYALQLLMKDGQILTLNNFENGAHSIMMQRATFLGRAMKKPVKSCSQGSFLEVINLSGKPVFKIRTFSDYHGSSDFIVWTICKWILILCILGFGFAWLMSATRVR